MTVLKEFAKAPDLTLLGEKVPFAFWQVGSVSVQDFYTASCKHCGHEIAYDPSPIDDGTDNDERRLLAQCKAHMKKCKKK